MAYVEAEEDLLSAVGDLDLAIENISAKLDNNCRIKWRDAGKKPQN